jgi:hypothetical protein
MIPALLTSPQNIKQRLGSELARSRPKSLVSIQSVNCETARRYRTWHRPDWQDLIAAVAELALDESAVLVEKSCTTSDTLLSFDAKDFAELIAAAFDMVVIGLMLPLESVVPVIVVTTGPPGLSEVIVVVTSGGSGNEVEGNGLAVVDPVVWEGSVLDP